jgi:hypothetical protein
LSRTAVEADQSIIELNMPGRILMPRIIPSLLICALAWQGTIALAAGACAPILLSESDLDNILDQALGSLRSVVESSQVTIVPEDTSCYVHIALTTKDVPIIMPSCQMHACSVAAISGSRIALRAFDIAGCDALFSGLSLPRHVPTSYADGAERIRKQCGAEGFEIRSATPRREGKAPVVSLELQAVHGAQP